jgi:hypothetical protein
VRTSALAAIEALQRFRGGGGRGPPRRTVDQHVGAQLIGVTYALGIDVGLMRSVTFAVGCGLAGMGGYLVVPLITGYIGMGKEADGLPQFFYMVEGNCAAAPRTPAQQQCVVGGSIDRLFGWMEAKLCQCSVHSRNDF